MTEHLYMNSPENCAKIFITWKWAVGFFLSLLATVAVLGWKGGTEISTIQQFQKGMIEDIASVQGDLDNLRVIHNDLDSIKMMIRLKR